MSPSQSALVARFEVEDVVVRMFVATDERSWPEVEACFANPFILDMTSMLGGEPASMTPNEVTHAWAEGFRNLDHVHHQVGNFQTTIAGDFATVCCYGVAFHHRTAVATSMNSRIFVGTYEVDLAKGVDGWCITRLMFKLKFIDGNPELEKSA